MQVISIAAEKVVECALSQHNVLAIARLTSCIISCALFDDLGFRVPHIHRLIMLCNDSY